MIQTAKSLSVEERRAIRRQKSEDLKRRKEARAAERRGRYCVYYGDASPEDRVRVRRYLDGIPAEQILGCDFSYITDCVKAARRATRCNATLVIPRLACASRRCLDILSMLEETGDFIVVCDLLGATTFILQIQAAMTEHQDAFKFPIPAASH